MPEPTPESPDPSAEYREALRAYDGTRLSAIMAHWGGTEPRARPAALISAITERLGESRTSEKAIDALGRGARVALGLLSACETSSVSTAWLLRGLDFLGVPSSAIAELLDLGLLAFAAEDGRSLSYPFGQLISEEPDVSRIIPHPGPLSDARTLLPDGLPFPIAEGVRQVRESDGLEPILRIAALWQRVAEDPLRQTQQGTLYKRDSERLAEDPAISGPIADSLAPLEDMASLWFDLARSVGLLRSEPGTDRLVAAPASFWAENAVHLPRTIAVRWFTLSAWSEVAGRWEGRPFVAASPSLRAPALLWLAAQEEGAWTHLENLSAHLASLSPGWEHLDQAESSKSPRAPRRGKKEEPTAPGVLERLLLGAAYQMGLVRAAEEVPSGRRLVQITPLGRYVLALGPPPSPRAGFEHFLYVQPNFEIIAYRQGLNPSLIGQLSRFTRWERLGAALELSISAESAYRGFEGELSPSDVLDRLSRHSARPLPAGIGEAVRTWSQRRERVTYYPAATLVEFPSSEALEAALASWTAESPSAAARISDRLVLVEDEATIPFHSFRLAGSRDYRRAPEPCVEVEPDGVTLSLDLGRSDLFVDAEIARFADGLPSDGPAGPRRRYRVSPASLSRALESGLSPLTLGQWFPTRTGSEMPPALRLLLHASTPQAAPLHVSQPILLTVPTGSLLDGLIQHPRTRDYLGERVGPTSILVPAVAKPGLIRALSELGLKVEMD